MFKIYGDYGYVSETLLEELNSFNEAKDWVEKYIADGDFGGYNIIEIAQFHESGEYLVEKRYDATDFVRENF